MSEVSYQSFLPGGGPGAGVFLPLPPEAIGTRAKAADRTVRVRVSKRQERWLDRVTAAGTDGVDRDAVVRALIDLGRELEVDWGLINRPAELRAAVRESVRVRRTPDAERD